ncbi:MAG TPA: hypothetical protein VMD91_12990 [Candidatus Sulfotelmatobacter sp.]|nr:hypothetical protein [Candidatus Sulfotelmatobacter sp.]
MVWFVGATVLLAQASPAPTAHDGIPVGTATVFAALLSAIALLVGAWLTRLSQSALSKQAHDQTVAELQRKEQLDVAAAVEKERGVKAVTDEYKQNATRRAIAATCEALQNDLLEMERKIVLLCSLSRAGKRVSRAQAPARLLEIAYAIHMPIARFRSLSERHAAGGTASLQLSLTLRQQWLVLEYVEKMLLADEELAESAPPCNYVRPPEQSLNPEAFLRALLGKVPLKGGRRELIRYSVLRFELPQGTLSSAMKETERVVDDFTVARMPVFWRILLAEIILVHLYVALRAQQFTTLQKLLPTFEALDPRIGAQLNRSAAFDQPLAAVCAYLEATLVKELHNMLE